MDRREAKLLVNLRKPRTKSPRKFIIEKMLIPFALLSGLVYSFLVLKQFQLGLLNLHNPQQNLLVIISLLILFLAYFFFYWINNWKRAGIKAILFVALVFNVIFLFVPFLTSNDLHSYIFAGRIFSGWGENPYLVPYDAFPQDEFYQSIRTIWATHTTLYGPLFLLLGGLINFLGQNNLLLTTFLFKLVLVGANIINTFLVYKISKNKKATFLYGLNPLVIFELSGNAHTESLLISFLLLSLLFVRVRPISSFGALTLSMLVKYSTFIFAPLYLIYFKRKGWITLTAAVFLGLGIVIAAYLPFWEGPHIFDYLAVYYNGQYVSPSPGILVAQAILGSYQPAFKVNTFIFLIVAGWLIAKFWFSKRTFKQLVFCSFLFYWIYLLTKLSLVLTWYLTPLVALGSLCATWSNYRKYALASIAFVSIYSLLLYYFVR